MTDGQRAFDTADPALDIREFGNIEPAFMGDAGVSHQRNIGTGQAFADEPVRPGQLHVHDAKGAAAFDHQLRINLFVRQFEIVFLEPAHGDGGFVRILLPEQPGIHLRAFECAFRDQVRAFCQIQHDGV